MTYSSTIVWCAWCDMLYTNEGQDSIVQSNNQVCGHSSYELSSRLLVDDKWILGRRKVGLKRIIVPPRHNPSASHWVRSNKVVSSTHTRPMFCAVPCKLETSPDACGHCTRVWTHLADMIVVISAVSKLRDKYSKARLCCICVWKLD